jgi:TPP-dependent pyruvate/acetoin dehydrogenase alpha subunit
LSAVKRCREGDGPILLEAETYRWQGHYEGDAQPYKPADESAAWKRRDPLVLARQRLLEERAVAEQLLDSSVSDARVTVDEAVERARAAPAPQLEDAYAHVFSD